MSYRIAIKTVGQPPEPEDGSRVLVDRLWPRGRSREALAIADWYRDASPSPTLHRQLRQGEISAGVFAVRYRGELRDHPDRLLPLMRQVRQRGALTLLTAERDPESSPFPILRERLLFALREEDAEDLQPASPPCFAHELRDDPDA
ncbi:MULTISPECIES: DUF488 domain-containing protein [unclassified Halomonas]|jgi:uncharacterized protein YeaO (DUF488 family)|uniref:DUF488 domain-containing protein n=1 Tax=unclassified Halomonas TaxID=2609666 RepID=UPI0003B8946E|nr:MULTISPECIES: DUF488 family protein [unclassified Halomonas]ERS82292.1 hypothetical protein Q671_12100 [Halomonas sp. PBN3]